MLVRDPAGRFSAAEALKHTFFSKMHTHVFDKEKILKRMKNYRAPLVLQQQTLMFIANKF